jgi:aspartyl-tRNA(Asn)/glutamyl-tRNA(Gln) amidotransferase subunit B
MQEGSLRCDVNISVRPVGRAAFGTKVEIKNMNSFNAIQRAIDYEIERQIEAIEQGEAIVQETRLWEETTQQTRTMRIKEGSSDYRYFPEPDLTPLEVPLAQLDQWRSELPELPAQKRHRYEGELGLSAYDARVLTDDRSTAEYFETTLAAGADAKQSANWVMGDLAGYLNSNREVSFETLPLRPEGLAELLGLIEQGTISGKIAKELLPDLLQNGGSPRSLVEAKGLTQISDPNQLIAIIDELLAAHPEELTQYRSGKKKLQGFFVGQLMKKTSGRADPKLANQLLTQKLDG